MSERGDEGRFRFVDSVTSDLSFEAEGPTLAAVFRAAADALLEATVEHRERIEPRVEQELALSDTEADLLLLRFLNELIYLRDAEGLLLFPRALTVEGDLERGGELHLSAQLVGEPFDLARHGGASEPKAVTAHGLQVERGPRGIQASVTIDV